MADQQSVLQALRASVDDLARQLDRLPAQTATWCPADQRVVVA